MRTEWIRPRPADEDEIARDGESVRVAMYLMDGVQKSVALHDGMSGAAGQRNGFVFADDDGRSEAARAEYLQQTVNAWRGHVYKADDRELSHDEARDEYLKRLRNAWRGAR